MFRFNDELLLSKEDRDLAQVQFPDIFFALDHPDLRTDFKSIDAKTNKAKSRSRLIGCCALGAAVLSLLTFPLEPLIKEVSGEAGQATAIFRIMAMIGAACSLLAIVLGNFGFGFVKSKRAWLTGRLMTERLRQWHAQYLIAHAADVAAAAGDEDAEADYLKARSVTYQRFKRSFLDHVSSEYTKYTERASVGPGGPRPVAPGRSDAFWIEPVWADAVKRRPEAEHAGKMDAVLAAYEETRMAGQIQYTNYILSSEGKFWSLPAKQIAILGNLSFGLIIFAFSTNIVALLSTIFPAFPITHSILGSIAILFALIAVGVRALEEGLRPKQEYARMENYAVAVEQAHDFYTRAKSVNKKREAAILLEQASYDEMIDFLSANEVAKFVI